MNLERLLNVLGTSVPDLDADDIADALYLAIYLCELKSATDARSFNHSKSTTLEPAPRILEPQPESSPSLPNTPASLPPAQPQPVPSSTLAAGLYARPQMINDQGGLVFRSPQAPPLPGWNELARALRPLHIHVPSHQSQVLDILATVQQIAESRIWIPVLRPLAESYFEVALVMDDTPTMAIWQSIVYELSQLIQRHSAFGKLQSYRLRFDKAGMALLAPGLMSISGETPRVNARHLSNLSGRTLILIVSDAAGAHWRDGRMSEVIATWADHSLVSLIQVLPTIYWDRSALGSWPAARADAGKPGSPNWRLPYVARRGRLGRPTPSGVPLPVLNLDPVALSQWARLAAGIPAASTPAYLLPSAPSTALMDHLPADALNPDTIVNTFLGSASPVAQHLAGLLAAAAPLSLPVARLVQGALLPESRQIHLAEVWLSGLLLPTDTLATGRTDPNELIYEFQPGVRDRLYTLAPASESLAVLRAVSGYIGARIGQPRDFRAWVQSDDGLDADDPRRPFAAVAAQILRGMGGAYRDLAERLAQFGGSALSTTWQPDTSDRRVRPDQQTDVIHQESEVLFAGRYRIEAQIGIGRFARTLRAYDTFERRAVLIKQLREELRISDLHRTYFEREARILNRLAHPGIVRLFDYGDVNGELYMVMELLNTQASRQSLESMPAILAALRPVAEAIDSMHQARYLHNDIKPINLFWRDEGTFVLASFGSAVTTDEVATVRDFFGTPGYLAPEVIAGGLPTPASDIYSFGLTIADLLTSAVSNQISSEVDNILQAASSKEPIERPSSAVGILEALKIALTRPNSAIETTFAGEVDTRVNSGGYPVLDRATVSQTPDNQPDENHTAIDLYLQQFTELLNLTLKDKEAILNEFSDFREKAMQKSARTRILDIALFGSISRNTAIRPLSDIDILVLYGVEPQVNPVEIYHELERLVGGIYPGREVIGASERRAWPKDKLLSRFPQRPKLSSMGASVIVNTGNTTLEISPCIIRKSPRFGNTIIVPARDLLTWTTTNHLTHNLIASELNNATSGGYQRLVRLFKHWHHDKFPTSPVLKGFVLECLVAQYIDYTITSISENFSLIMRRILQERGSHHRFVAVPEPGKRVETKRTNLSGYQFVSLRNEIAKTVALLDKTLQSTTMDEELEVWQRIMGRAFSDFSTKSLILDTEINTQTQRSIQDNILLFSNFRPERIGVDIQPKNVRLPPRKVIPPEKSSSSSQSSSQSHIAASTTSPEPPRPQLLRLPAIGEIFTGKIIEIDDSAAVIAVPNFRAEHALGLLSANMADLRKFKVGNTARVEVVEQKIQRSGRILLIVQRASRQSKEG